MYKVNLKQILLCRWVPFVTDFFRLEYSIEHIAVLIMMETAVFDRVHIKAGCGTEVWNSFFLTTVGCTINHSVLLFYFLKSQKYLKVHSLTQPDLGTATVSLGTTTVDLGTTTVSLGTTIIYLGNTNSSHRYYPKSVANPRNIWTSIFHYSTIVYSIFE